MLNSLVSELSAVLDMFERCHLIEHFSLSVAALRPPTPPVSNVLLSLLTALEEHRLRLGELVGESPPRQAVLSGHYSQDEWLEPHDLTKDEYFNRSSPLNFIKPELPEPVLPENVEMINYTAYNETSPECLEALNLSVAASPECLEAINLSVVTSPCYNPIDEASHSRQFKHFQDVGTTTAFWDQVALDVGTEPDCFESENAAVQNVVNTAEGFNIDFSHDIDSASALGDNCMLDISSNVNVSVTDALNASIYFGLHRDGQEIKSLSVGQTDAPAPETTTESVPHPPAALDLSHPGPSLLLLHEDPICEQTFEKEPVADEKCQFICKVCGKQLQSRSSLHRHEAAHEQGQLICDHCGRAFNTGWMLRRHVLAHLSSFVCQLCGKRFVDARKLHRHMGAHYATSFACTICRKEFPREDNLKRHVEIVHYKSKEYCCQHCPKVFSVKCNLDVHIKNTHGDPECSSISCGTCGKKYKNKESFRVHTKSHGPPRHSCHLCTRTFNRLPLYRRHMRNCHQSTD